MNELTSSMRSFPRSRSISCVLSTMSNMLFEELIHSWSHWHSFPGFSPEPCSDFTLHLYCWVHMSAQLPYYSHYFCLVLLIPLSCSLKHNSGPIDKCPCFSVEYSGTMACLAPSIWVFILKNYNFLRLARGEWAFTAIYLMYFRVELHIFKGMQAHVCTSGIQEVPGNVWGNPQPRPNIVLGPLYSNYSATVLGLHDCGCALNERSGRNLPNRIPDLWLIDLGSPRP